MNGYAQLHRRHVAEEIVKLSDIKKLQPKNADEKKLREWTEDYIEILQEELEETL